MGITDFISDNFGVMTSSYRTSVLYDFSTVVKAVIHILKGGAPPSTNEKFNLGINSTWTYIKALPVQINPSQINRNRGSRQVTVKSLTGDYEAFQNPLSPNGFQHIRTRPEEDDSLSLLLKFDIFDEYKAVSMNSMLPVSLSLADKDVTIIEELFSYASVPDYAYLFMWGDVQFLGKVSSISSSYDCFSPYGQPLKADVNLTLAHQPVGFDDKGEELGLGAVTLGDAWAKIKGYASFNKAEVVAARAAEEAAVIAVPSILRKIRNE